MSGVRIAVTLNAKKAIRATRKLNRRIPVVTAQELNTQRRQSRTRMTRRLSKLAGVKPQKRIRRRILMPRSTAATPRRLTTLGLTLFEAFPARYWPGSMPGAARVSIQSEGVVDSSGRRTVGGSFKATMPNDYTGVFRRLSPSHPQKHGLPIRNVVVVSLERVGYKVREEVLGELAKEWKARWENRIDREIKRTFG